MKNFAEINDNCRTVHAFTDRKVEETHVIEALEQSLRAPNHKFTFPWKYFWASSPQKEKLAKLSAIIKSGKADPDPETLSAMKNKVLNPELIVFCQKKSESDFQSKEDYATLSCSVQLFALSLAEKGIGYKWSTGGLTRDQRAYTILNIDPSQYEIIGFIFAGYALNPPKPRNRPSLEDVLVRREEM